MKLLWKVPAGEFGIASSHQSGRGRNSNLGVSFSHTYSKCISRNNTLFKVACNCRYEWPVMNRYIYTTRGNFYGIIPSNSFHELLYTNHRKDAISKYRQNAFANFICFTIRQSGSNNEGFPTSIKTVFARDTATFSRCKL